MQTTMNTNNTSMGTTTKKTCNKKGDCGGCKKGADGADGANQTTDNNPTTGTTDKTTGNTPDTQQNTGNGAGNNNQVSMTQLYQVVALLVQRLNMLFMMIMSGKNSNSSTVAGDLTTAGSAFGDTSGNPQRSNLYQQPMADKTDGTISSQDMISWDQLLKQQQQGLNNVPYGLDYQS